MKAALIVLLILVLAAIAVIGIMIHQGLSARQEPTRAEEIIARSVRRFAMPSSARNDGSGQTEMGRNLYPKAPDMRQPRTQQLSDGELFSIIKNGIRVHFIRHLPKNHACRGRPDEGDEPGQPG
jgi:hypothetical protein